MTLRDFPIIPTIFVVAAAATMVALGIWQIGRAEEKAELIAAFKTAQSNAEMTDIAFGQSDLVYRAVRLNCPEATGWHAVAGRSERGQTGYVHRYVCDVRPTFGYGDAGPAVVTHADIGWSLSPAEPDFAGGFIEGTLVALGDGYKVVASTPQAGLQPIAKPDPNDLPNNHIAYAGQWFFFAITALVIYFLALRSRTARVSRSKSA